MSEAQKPPRVNTLVDAVVSAPCFMNPVLLAPGFTDLSVLSLSSSSNGATLVERRHMKDKASHAVQEVPCSHGKDEDEPLRGEALHRDRYR